MRNSRLGHVLLSAAGVALGALVLALGAAPVASAHAACAGADTATTNVRTIQRAVLCLHNVERRQHGLSRLRWNRDLARAGASHDRDMVTHSYFAHVSANGQDHMDRVAASGYQPKVGCWTAGENLYYSTGPQTPRQLLKAWMKSSAHRANILHRGWHDFGLGVVSGSPRGDAHGLTVVALFGVRSKAACG
jgi:uncharacterized protein YkwD